MGDIEMEPGDFSDLLEADIEKSHQYLRENVSFMLEIYCSVVKSEIT